MHYNEFTKFHLLFVTDQNKKKDFKVDNLNDNVLLYVISGHVNSWFIC